jgi:small subunit ribosomal protein S16
MAVVIRLMRAGAKKRPFYRIVVADSRRQRDGRFVEILGFYDPMKKPHHLEFEKDKTKTWLEKGAQPSTQVASLLRAEGMTWVNASKPKKKAAAKASQPAAKRKPRKLSERKARAKAARKAGKKKPAARKEKKK